MPAPLAIIPWPRSVDARDGELLLPRGARAEIRGGGGDPLLARTAERLAEVLPSGPRAHEASIVIEVAPDGRADPESYTVEVTRDLGRVRAASPRGAFYGAETLAQLVEPAPDGSRVPAVRIEDAPRFRWRGLHLDVGRHWMPVASIERWIDAIARFKLNTFHWHLTEDQGWRLEIRRYPRLVEIGSKRKETIVGHARRGPKGYDGVPYAGHYTPDEARHVVAYARERGVTVVPEIEMPGHSLAALAAYPELACRPGPFEVRTTWGISEEVYCPKEQTFEFLENVLREVMAIFPSRYIHIGGDEAPKTRWRECRIAQDLIAREGLRDEDELQSWFIRRIERFLAANGRRLVGWDEILEGGLAPNATVMSWRGTAGGIVAARAGHDVVMCPQEDLYFDHYQGPVESEPLAIGGMTTLDDVYRYEPVPAELTDAEAAHVLGAQGQLWTEYMRTPEHVEYMAFPRAIALAEIVWSPREARDPAGFRARLPRALAELDRLGIRYRRPEDL
ncbi:MAG TPA: beta-N-acetylhexosaminidase [Candidatus Limnocylindria bacterium]|nr:beta-N-acetylhexosaminidase [Candidatus Limnocylindria bacterium]